MNMDPTSKRAHLLTVCEDFVKGLRTKLSAEVLV
jgi:hypothetical protein